MRIRLRDHHKDGRNRKGKIRYVCFCDNKVYAPDRVSRMIYEARRERKTEEFIRRYFDSHNDF